MTSIPRKMMDMQTRYHQLKKHHRVLKSSFLVARQYLELFNAMDSPNADQCFSLARAHYTLGLQQNISKQRCKMHFNSSITLLKNLPENKKCDSWASLIANSYAKRAFLLDQEGKTSQALEDYFRVLALFKSEPDLPVLDLPVPDLPNLPSLTDLFKENQAEEHDIKKNRVKENQVEEYDIKKNRVKENQVQLKENLVKGKQALAGHRTYLNNLDKLLLAETSIAIAEVLLDPSFFSIQLGSPQFYIYQALDCLINLAEPGDEILIALAHSYQLLALSYLPSDVEAAFLNFNLALKYAFKASSKAASQILGDIYQGLGLIFELKQEPLELKPTFQNRADPDHALIYFALTLFFYPSSRLKLPPILEYYQNNDWQEILEDPEHTLFLEIIYDNIHRAISPYPYPISLETLKDIIDGLIFVYFCILDNTLPNQALLEQLKEEEQLENLAQHIYWLVLEYNQRLHQSSSLLTFMKELDENISQDISKKIKGFFTANKKANIIPLRNFQVQVK